MGSSEKEKLRHFGLVPDMAAKKYGDRTAFFFDGEEQSFDEFKERTNKVANALVNIGVEPEDRVCLHLPNTPQFPEAYFGIIKAGAVAVPLNLRMPPKTLVYVVNNADAETIVGSDLRTEVSSPRGAKELAKDSGVKRLLLPGESGDGIIDYSNLVNQASPEFDLIPRDFEDTAVQLYTSGTTGRPKGVLLTHKNLLSTIETFSEVIKMAADFLGADTEDPGAWVRGLQVLPLYHVYGLTAGLCNIIYSGGSMVLQPEPDAELILRNIERHKCNLMMAVPAILRMMLSEYEKKPEEYDLSSLFLITCAAAPLDEETRDKIQDDWGVILTEGWGMTETSPVGAVGISSKGAGCIGRPQPNVEMKIVDPETRKPIVPRKVIASGEPKEDHIKVEGELAIRGPQVMKGYYKMPDKTEETFDDEGWFYTGDIVRIDEDGDLWMVERADDMIISGGENIYPAEVERALHDHPDVEEAAVVAAPHKVKGEAPVAFVVPKPDAELTEEEIREFSLERVATYAHPRRVFFVDELPKSGTMKTQRFKLEGEAKKRLSEPLGSE